MGRVQSNSRQHAAKGRQDRRRHRQVANDDGAGLLATSIGVLVFLLLMLVAVQVVYQLYAASTVTAAAFDGARLAAGASLADDPDEGARVARARVVDLLGSYGRTRVETLDVARDGDVVALHIVTKNPGFLPLGLRRPLGLDEIDRTVRVRVEREVAP